MNKITKNSIKLIVCFVVIFAGAFLWAASPVNKAQAFNYVFGRSDYAEPSPAQPAKGDTYTDSVTNMPIKRITNCATDIPGGSSTTQCHIHYVRTSPVSSDGRYLLIEVSGPRTGSNPYFIYDLASNTVRIAPHITGSPYAENYGYDTQPEYRWDHSGNHPTWIYYRLGAKVYRGDVSYPAGQPNHPDYNVLLRNFNNDNPAWLIVYNDDEGDMDASSTHMPLMARTSNWQDPVVLINYNLANNTYTSLSGQTRPNFVDMSPDGNRFLAPPYTWNNDFGDRQTIVSDSAHSGWAWDNARKLGFVQINNAGVSDHLKFVNPANSSDYITIANQADFAWGDHHFSRVYGSTQKNWVIMDWYQDAGWSRRQIMGLEIKPENENPRTWRIAYTQNYYAPNSHNDLASISQDGTKIYFCSNWRGTSVSEIYEVQLPANWWNDLNVSGVPDTTPPSAPTGLMVN